MIQEILRLIIAFLKIIYITIITIFIYLYNYNTELISNFLENLNVYGTIDNLDKYYNFKKNHTNGIAIFTHTSYLDGIILAKELKEPPSFVCLKQSLISLFYDIAKKWNCLIIEPKQNNTKTITNTVLDRNKNQPLLFIAPTGGNMEQRDAFTLKEFKTGAFVSLSPVLPILISYNPHIYIKDNSNMIYNFIDIINIDKLTYKITILDPIYPTDTDTINTFKDRVYNIMNQEKKKIIVEDYKITENNYNKKIFTIIIILIIISYFIFSKNINFYISFSLIILLFITIILRNKNVLFNYLYKNLIYIYSFFLTLYSTTTSNYLLFMQSIIYPFIYKYFSK